MLHPYDIAGTWVGLLEHLPWAGIRRIRRGGCVIRKKRKTLEGTLIGTNVALIGWVGIFFFFLVMGGSTQRADMTSFIFENFKEIPELYQDWCVLVCFLITFTSYMFCITFGKGVALVCMYILIYSLSHVPPWGNLKSLGCRVLDIKVLMPSHSVLAHCCKIVLMKLLWVYYKTTFGTCKVLKFSKLIVFNWMCFSVWPFLKYICGF